MESKIISLYTCRGDHIDILNYEKKQLQKRVVRQNLKSNILSFGHGNIAHCLNGILK